MNHLIMIYHFDKYEIMFDINYLRKNIKFISENLKLRGFILDSFYFLKIDNDIKILKTNIYKLQHKHKLMSFLVKELHKHLMCNDHLIKEISLLKIYIQKKKKILDELINDFSNFLLSIPNILDKSVPCSSNEINNLPIRSFNSTNFNKSFILNDLENNNTYIDFELAAKLSKSGFVILKKELAQLHRALGNYMTDLHVIKHGYQEIDSPLLVNEKAMFSTGHFPKFQHDQFGIIDTNLWLIPTAEVTLTNLISEKFLTKSSLPFNFVAKTKCFRKEKGNYGYQVKGMIRQHQFEKVELVKVVAPEYSYDALEELTYHAEIVLQNLNLSYRIISLCNKDLGFASSKTYDLEIWFPKRKMYVEVSSCSNILSFQSVRMKTKLTDRCLNNNVYPHTLNGSGLAVGRVFLAIIENYSDIDGNLIIPDVLVQYMNGKKLIKFR